jgi:ornithine cyclodeaminase
MPPTVDAIGVLGTGLQARMQVEALGAVTPVRRVVVWGRRRDAAELCAADLSARGFETDVADTPQDVAARANLIVTATASHAPLLAAGDVRPGTHITAMGSDTETKQELDTALVARADRLVADSLAQCRERGEISHALRCGAIAPEVPVELGDVIRGRAPGRLRAQDITIADLTGVAVQDIAVTKAVLSLL